MLANEIFDAYFRALAESGPVTDYVRAPLWTRTATTALARVGLLAFPEGNKAAKNHRDPYGRSEYLTLDVTITDPATWGPPLFVAEHENSTWKWKVGYCAWKLLAVEARRRVLVAYFGERTEFRTFEDLKRAVEEVTNDNPGKDLLLIGGNAMATPTNVDELRKAHETAIVGTHTAK